MGDNGFFNGITLLLLNSNTDTIELLTDWFGALGAIVHHARSLDLCVRLDDARKLVETIDPDAILFDLAVPYDRNWTCFQRLQTIGLFDAIPVILTTVNRRALDHIVGPKEAFEVLGTPNDLWKLQDLVQWRIAGKLPSTDGTTSH